MAGTINANSFNNAELRLFVQFANDKGSNAQTAKIAREGGGRIDAVSSPVGWKVRRNKSSEAARGAIKDNNEVRDMLVRALKAEYRVNGLAELPKKVRAALVGSFARTAEQDFQFDANGKTDSGKPLTRRRIKAVLNAVKADHDEVNKKAFRLFSEFIKSTNGIKQKFKTVSDIKQGYDECLKPKIDEAISTGKINKGLLFGALELFFEDYPYMIRSKLLPGLIAMLAEKGVKLESESMPPLFDHSSSYSDLLNKS